MRAHTHRVTTALLASLLLTGCGLPGSPAALSWHRAKVVVESWPRGERTLTRLHLPAAILRLGRPDPSGFALGPEAAIDRAGQAWPKAAAASTVVVIEGAVEGTRLPTMPSAYLILFQGRRIGVDGAAPPWAPPPTGPATVVVVVDGRSGVATLVMAGRP
jgi:hypothetical protein